MLFQRLIWAALLTALLVGSLQTGVQRLQTVPLIQAAEAYEGLKAAASESALAPVAPVAAAHAHGHDQAHSHAGDAAEAPSWTPEDGLERTFWTWVANVLHAFGMALLVFAAMGAGQWRAPQLPSVWLASLVAGAGWLSLDMWPALGLPAEIPGMDAQRLGSRQGWWLLAAGSAAGACALMGFWHRPLRWVLAAVLLAVPFVVGAPHLTSDPLAGFSGEAQAVLRDLARQFTWATAWVSLSFWAGMGVVSAVVFARWIRPTLTGLLPRRAPSVASSLKVNK